MTTPTQTMTATAQSGAGPARQDQQWRIRHVQVINWGGFEGLNTLEFHPFGTLVTGASGCGKSTLLDAYLALMMPSSVALNGASNQAEGRARSEGQRNPLSYMRGKTDADTDPVTGEEIAQVLRGKNRATWSVIAAEFVSDTGSIYTLFRTYFATASVQTNTEIQMRMFTRPGQVDLHELASLVSTGFKPSTVEKTLAGAKHRATYDSFAAAFHAALGIGASGDGAKAINMLAQIQAGGSISTVNDLYRDRVLERPETYAKAKSAVEHFNNLQAMYQKMRTEQDKADRLAPIPDIYRTATECQDELETIDSFGINRQGDTPFTEWRLHTEDALLDLALTANKADRSAAEQAQSRALEDEKAVADNLEQARETRRALGGDRLDEIDASIQRLDAARTSAEIKRDNVLTHIQPLVEEARLADSEPPLASADALSAAQATAQAFIAAAPTKHSELHTTRTAIQERRYPLLEESRRLKSDIATMSRNQSRIDTRLDERRNALAHAAGLNPRDLPFVAELIDVADGQERWRTAADSVLGGLARTLLVDKEFLAEFSRRIDTVRLTAQLRFEGVPLRDHVDVDGDPERISGRIVHKPSPFSHWIASEISKRDAHCVASADGLNGPGYRVAMSGQTRNGTAGTVGQSGRHSIIGFANEQLIADLQADAEEVEQQLTDIDKELLAIERTIENFAAVVKAHERVAETVWSDVDVDGITSQLTRRHIDRSRLLAADVALNEIDQRITGLDGQLRKARKLTFTADQRAESLAKTFEELVTQQDTVHSAQDRIEHAGTSSLTTEQHQHLDAALAGATSSVVIDHQSFHQTWVSVVRNQLTERFGASQRRLGDMNRQLGTIFESYLAQWPDPNLSAKPEAYFDYQRILDDILATGLHARRVTWLEAVREWTAQDLLPLNNAIEKSLADIEKRLEDINGILADLPFGPGRDRLRISFRRLSPEAVVSFRKTLRRLANVPSRELSEDQLLQRFSELQDFIGLIRRSDDRHLTPEMVEANPGRDALLDVRRHIQIEAVRYSQTGTRLATYRRLSEKSGGETQELIAFILGSALRYRLGDEERSRPRFAPVFLDEGFIKADAEFAGRAVQAWQGLGFQLIIAAPFDKVSGLGEYMGTLAAVGKSQKTGFSQIVKVEPLEAFEKDPWIEATGGSRLDPTGHA